MENGPFIDGLPNLKMVDLSMAMLVITRWYLLMNDRVELSRLDCGFWIAPSYGKSLPENGCFYPSIQPISSPCIWAVGSNLDRSETSVSLADFKAGSTTWAFKPWKRTCFQLPTSHVCCKTFRQQGFWSCDLFPATPTWTTQPILHPYSDRFFGGLYVQGMSTLRRAFSMSV